MESPIRPHIPPVEPELLGSAAFIFREYLAQLAADNPVGTNEDEEDEDQPQPEVDTKAVLDLFADELATNVQTTLALFMRVTALYRMLAQSPSLTELALDPEQPGGALNENATIAAARLDVTVNNKSGDRTADFNPRQFREALEAD
jgi:hypothetical protein